MENNKGWALVTGASSGIGRAFANKLSEQGYDLLVVARRKERLDELVSAHPDCKIRPVVADLGTEEGIQTAIDACNSEPLELLINNAGVAHYMPFVDLPAEKALELTRVKVVAPTLLTRAAAKGMTERGHGAIINVAGMLAFSGPATLEKLPLRRAVYVGALAYEVAFSQTLREELRSTGVKVQVVCPGVVATEFHERQGLDLSKVPRMSPEEVVTASLADLEADVMVSAPGVEDLVLLQTVFQADLAAFGGQTPALATRYNAS